MSQGSDRIPLEQTAHVSTLAALAAWRVTQGIYRIDDTLFSELWQTPVRGALPVEVLERLPEWCVYVETPLLESTHGFFAFLEHDLATGRRELRFVFDMVDVGLQPAVIHLSGSLEDGLHDALVESRVQALRAGRAEFAPALQHKQQARFLEGFVSVLLYLCADDAEIADRTSPPARAWVHKRKGPALIAPPKPTIHETGTRLGAALFAAQQQHERADASGSGSTVEPHVRRAHWHHYWTGPRTGDRKLVLRWLSPILVGLDGVPEVPTVRPVKDADL